MGAKSIFALQYRRRHGCAAALGFAKLKLARAQYLLGSRDPAAAPPTRGGDFDPRSHAHFAQAGIGAQEEFHPSPTVSRSVIDARHRVEQ